MAESSWVMHRRVSSISWQRITRSDNLYKVLKVVECESSYIDSLKVPTCSSFLVKSSPRDSEDFFHGEQLATVVNPKCGSCLVAGSQYSYGEENKLKLID